MKCLVCGLEHTAAECPRCHFPDIQIMGDPEQERQRLEPVLRDYKINLLRGVKLSLPVYRWKDCNGQLVQERMEFAPLAGGEALLAGEVWYPEKFARIPDRQALPVCLRIQTGEACRDVQLELPNLLQPELQQLGAVLEEGLCLRLLLRNDTQGPVYSQPVPLFV